jgi:putative membrane protein
MRLLLRILITGAALWAAVHLVPGITYAGNPIWLFTVAIVFGVVNAMLKPVLMLLSLPFLVVTLGLFTFVVNALVLWMTSGAAGALGLGFHVAGFWPAFWGALLVSIVSTALSLFLVAERVARESST